MIQSQAYGSASSDWSDIKHTLKSLKNDVASFIKHGSAELKEKIIVKIEHVEVELEERLSLCQDTLKQYKAKLKDAVDESERHGFLKKIKASEKEESHYNAYLESLENLKEKLESYL